MRQEALTVDHMEYGKVVPTQKKTPKLKIKKVKAIIIAHWLKLHRLSYF